MKKMVGHGPRFGDMVPCAFCANTCRHGSVPHLKVVDDTNRVLVVSACTSPRCLELHAALVAEWRRAVAEGTVGAGTDMPAFIGAVQQRLLGRSAQA